MANATKACQLLLLCFVLNLCSAVVAEDPCAVAAPTTTANAVNPAVIGGSVAAGVAAAVGIGVGIWDGVHNNGKNNTNPREVVTSTTAAPAPPAPPVSPTTISPRVLDPTSTTVAAALSSSSSLPLWAWISLGFLLCMAAVCAVLLAAVVCKPRKKKATARRFGKVSATPAEPAEAETSFTPLAPLSAQMWSGYAPLPMVTHSMPAANIASTAVMSPAAAPAMWASPIAATTVATPVAATTYATAARLIPAYEAATIQAYAAPVSAVVNTSPAEMAPAAPSQASAGYAGLSQLAYGSVGAQAPAIVAEYVPAGSAI